MKAVSDIAFMFGHELVKDKIDALAGALTGGDWTAGELDCAVKLIPNDAELCKTISYNRTINPAVFAEARQRPAVMRGRTFSRAEAMRIAGDRPFSEVFDAFRNGESTVFVLR